MKKISFALVFGLLVAPFGAFATGPYNTTAYVEGKNKESLLKSLSVLSKQVSTLRIKGSMNASQETSFQSVVVSLMQNILADTEYQTYIKESGSMPFPVLTSLTKTSASIGETIVVNGKNLAGFEGDLYVWMENKDGRKALVQGINSNQLTTTEKIEIELQDKACEKNINYSGLPCPQYLVFTPGVYKMSTNPWGNESNTVTFEITSNGKYYTTAKVYVVNPSEDSSKECKVDFVPLSYGVSRTSPLKDSLNILLSTTSFGESGLQNPMGYFGLTLNSVSIKDSVASIRLSGQGIGTYCSQYQVFNQLKQTALQFNTVSEVEIYINDTELNFGH